MHWAAVVATILAVCAGGSYGQAEYLTDPTVRADIPKPASGQPLDVNLTFTLIDIVKVDAETNEVTFILWPVLQWMAENLQWDPEMFGNTTHVRLPIEKVWKPDVVPYSNSKPTQLLSPATAVISNDGRVLSIPSERVTLLCGADAAEAASEEGTTCSFKYGSWAYNCYGINLKDGGRKFVDLSDFSASSRYEILSNEVTREVEHYSCCPGSYIDLKVTLKFREKREDGFLSSLFD